jgi:chorismate mutase
MTLTEHEATLAAARTMLVRGPFWVLDLWDALPSPVQLELVEVLGERESFRDALAAGGLLDDDVDDDPDDDFDDQLDEWLESQGLDREIVESFARRRQVIKAVRAKTEVLKKAQTDRRAQPPPRRAREEKIMCTEQTAYGATAAGVEACARWPALPEAECWTEDRDRNGRYLVLMTLTDGDEAFTPPYTATRIVEALTDRDADPAVVAEIDVICSAMAAAGLLEVRPIGDADVWDGGAL